MYTFKQLATAKDILNSKEFFNDQSFNNGVDYIGEAKRIVDWFKALYKIAKLYKKHYLNDWHLSIKATWQTIKSSKFAGKDITFILASLRRQISRKKRLEEKARKGTPKLARIPQKMKQKTKASKSRKRMKDRNKTDFYHSLFAQGKPTIYLYGH